LGSRATASSGAKRIFRFVFFVGSGCRLQENPADPPATWQVTVAVGTDTAEVCVRDVVHDSSGVPTHLGLEVQIVVSAANWDEAFQRARGLATLYSSSLSVATRAWIETLEPVVAYEITPDVVDREFRQWHRDVGLPVGKTVVAADAFGRIQERLVALVESNDAFLTRMAVEFYVAGLRELEPVLRFMLFWPAAEALDPLLRNRLTRAKADQRHWGLKAFARELGEDPGLINASYDLRTDLFHVRPGRSTQRLIAEAGDLGSRLEALVVRAVCRVLDMPEAEQLLPTSPTSAHPPQVVVRARIQGDPSSWNRDTHPHVLPDFTLVRQAASDDSSVQAQLTATFKVQNCDQLRGPSIEIWGPEGPNVGKIELDSAKVIRESGEEEEVTLDPQ
jgi:hypothetical protein